VKEIGDERYVKQGRRLKMERHRILKMRNRIHCEQKYEYRVCKEKTFDDYFE